MYIKLKYLLKRHILFFQLLTPFYTASVTGVARDNEANIVAQDGEREIRAVAEITDSGFELKAYPYPREQTVVSIFWIE